MGVHQENFFKGDYETRQRLDQALPHWKRDLGLHFPLLKQKADQLLHLFLFSTYPEGVMSLLTPQEFAGLLQKEGRQLLKRHVTQLALSRGYRDYAQAPLEWRLFLADVFSQEPDLTEDEGKMFRDIFDGVNQDYLCPNFRAKIQLGTHYISNTPPTHVPPGKYKCGDCRQEVGADQFHRDRGICSTCRRCPD